MRDIKKKLELRQIADKKIIFTIYFEERTGLEYGVTIICVLKTLSFLINFHPKSTTDCTSYLFQSRTYLIRNNYLKSV